MLDFFDLIEDRFGKRIAHALELLCLIALFVVMLNALVSYLILPIIRHFV